jgi:hypothetical protein
MQQIIVDYGGLVCLYKKCLFTKLKAASLQFGTEGVQTAKRLAHNEASCRYIALAILVII